MSTVREAMLSELIGEVDDLLKRLEKVRSDLDARCAEITAAADRCQATTLAITEQAQTSAVQYIVKKTNEQVKSAETEIGLAIRDALTREISVVRKELTAWNTRQRPKRWWWVERLLGR